MKVNPMSNPPWIVRFDYLRLYPDGTPYRVSGELEVAAQSIVEAIDAVRAREAEFPGVRVWRAGRKGLLA